MTEQYKYVVCRVEWEVVIYIHGFHEDETVYFGRYYTEALAIAKLEELGFTKDPKWGEYTSPNYPNGQAQIERRLVEV